MAKTDEIQSEPGLLCESTNKQDKVTAARLRGAVQIREMKAALRDCLTIPSKAE